MIVCCILGGLVILLSILAIVFKNEDLGDVFCVLNAVLILIASCVAFLLVLNFITLPETNATNQARYDEIIYELDHLDQYNVFKVQNDVNEWNEYYIKAQYGKSNPWVNWWYQADISHFNLLELDTSQSCPCCGRPLSQPVKVVESDSR